ncbi:M56 family metallopeptidase [Chitinophaga pinensis]|uniref:Peptidase M56 BlaR1 n=1 Tax=Chitinophaga pinensis (strain ATCC 43595 / DSM 2588 / LMG 13176 / NBRC 15968 / NCIMB 11800 / UQM 2034) TaxID=485918 RepID=A0A979GZK0_CHIPD|nr:M56 family metallopeptidase [Chitinophaga pinensis]ACU62630.1 peptidase M56 BlaR1 [Chitinophaga pinensis DSM 2588]
MQLSFLPEPLLKAICWTLIHSLWEGLVITLLAGLVIIITRKTIPTLRYNLLSGLFLLFIIVSGFTFQRVYRTFSNDRIALSGVAPQTTVVQQDASFPPAIIQKDKVYEQRPFSERFIAYFDRHAPLIVTIWFIIFSCKFVIMLSSLNYLQRIRYRKTHQPDSYWKQRINTFRRQLGITKAVLLLESEIVKAPAVIGFLKPVILIPFGLMSQLPADQIEAILLHELAHIKRRDYLVNLMQSFAEMIFFFNPAILWLSALIRQEREHCCDDIAIAVTKDKGKFINALVAFQDHNISMTYEMAFPGRKNQLLERVKRILNNNNTTLNVMEKISLISCFVVISVFAVAFSTPEQQPSASYTQSLIRTTPQNIKTMDTTAPLVSAPPLSMEELKERNEQSAAAARQNVEKLSRENEETQHKIISDIVKAKVVTDKAQLFSYKLSNTEFLVNDVKQPTTLFEKFKEKYIKSPGTTVLSYQRVP